MSFKTLKTEMPQRSTISSNPPAPRLLPKVGRQFAKPDFLTARTVVGVLVVASAWILTSGFSPEAQATLTVFVAAIWLWVFGSSTTPT